MRVVDTRMGPMMITNIRLPTDLHQRLADASQETCRSLTSEIIFRLRQSLKAEAAREESAT